MVQERQAWVVRVTESSESTRSFLEGSEERKASSCLSFVSRPLDKDLGDVICFSGDSRKQVREGSRQDRDKWRKLVLMSRLLLWAIGTPAEWGPCERAPELSN